MTRPRGKLIEAGETRRSAKPLTDRDMKAMLPMYVESKKPDEDHKCGGCWMRVGDDDACIIVRGDISMTAGVCSYWSRRGPKGEKESSPDKIHEALMAKRTAGYAEYRVAVRCDSCIYYLDEAKPYCRLWQGRVKPADCCVSYESPDNEVTVV